MTTRHRLTLPTLVLALAGALLVSGCASLPESGPVHRMAQKDTDPEQGAYYFHPPGPQKDSNPAQIVSDFLIAMQANPLSTTVARQFLSQRAKDTWRPNQGTIVYEGYSVLPGPGGVNVRLTDTRRLDARGGWQGGKPGRTETLDFSLVNEDGQWRIDNPANALVVPSSYFDRSFARFNLYFFDQTGRTLLPDPVFIPRGEQSATNLVRGLLAGPGTEINDVSRSALPPGTGLDLSVVVTEGGIAEVPLSREMLSISPSELSRAVAQLAWTLRQVPGIERVRVTVGGTPVPMANGSIDTPVTEGEGYDAAGTGAAFFWGLRGGRLVDLGSDPTAIGGPLGKPGYALRSFAVSETPRRIAGVSVSGHAVYVAPTTGTTARSRPLRLLDNGTNVLRPQYDLFGDL